MFKHVVKGLLAGMAVKLPDRYRRLSIQLLKIEAAKGYSHGMRMARMAAIGMMCMGLFAAMIGAGVLLVHAGLFILLPWSVEAKAILGISLGVTYGVIGGIALRAAMSERTWLEKSGAATMLDEATARPLKD